MVFIKGSFVTSAKKSKIRALQILSLLIQKIFTILVSIIKLTGKQTDVTQAEFCGILLCRQCLNYKTKLEKKFKGYISEIVRRQTIFESAKQVKKRDLLSVYMDVYPSQKKPKACDRSPPPLCGRQKRMTPNSNYVKRRRTL